MPYRKARQGSHSFGYVEVPAVVEEELLVGGDEVASLGTVRDGEFVQERMAALADLPEPDMVAAEAVVEELIGPRRPWYVRVILWAWNALVRVREKVRSWHLRRP